MVQWNVERGYRLGSVVAELVDEQPDIVLLQEVDVGCNRSFLNDVGGEIALALGMHCAYASEKDGVNELRGAKEDHADPGDEAAGVAAGVAAVPSGGGAGGEEPAGSGGSGGSGDGGSGSGGGGSSGGSSGGGASLRAAQNPISPNWGGVEGVAVLSKYPITSVRAIALGLASSPSQAGTSGGQSYGGGKARVALRVEVAAPDHIGPVVCYSCHLDAFAGRTARVHQLQPVLEDAAITAFEAMAAGKGSAPHLILGGDLNTHNHGLARFSRKFSGEEGMAGLGKTEAQWWDEVVFANTALKDPFDKAGDSHNTWITVAGIPVWGGKIDWLLYSEATLVCDGHFVSEGNKSSDHPFLRVDLRRASEL